MDGIFIEQESQKIELFILRRLARTGFRWIGLDSCDGEH
jgi:hypothetical protein